eukprot:UN21064
MQTCNRIFSIPKENKFLNFKEACQFSPTYGDFNFLPCNMFSPVSSRVKLRPKASSNWAEALDCMFYDCSFKLCQVQIQ